MADLYAIFTRRRPNPDRLFTHAPPTFPSSRGGSIPDLVFFGAGIALYALMMAYGLWLNRI
jgi:hypothetical protein